MSPLPAPWLSRLDKRLQWPLLILCAGAAGSLLGHLAMPAAHFLGPMLIAITFGVAGATIRLPRIGFRLGQGCVGVMVAHAMTLAVFQTLIANWPAMLAATMMTVIFSALVGSILVRYSRLPGSTAVWGTSPGAAAAMTAMAEDYGADPRIVATMQYVRVVCVVVTASLVSRWLSDYHGVAATPQDSFSLSDMHFWPFAISLAIVIVGVGISGRIPAGALLVPLMIATALQLSGVLEVYLPDWLLVIAYGMLGTYVGLRFDRQTVRMVVASVPVMITSAMVLIALCAISAWFLASFLHTDFISAFLATSPGGLDSLAIIAVDIKADAGLVLALQTLRLFFVILTGPWLAKKMLRLVRTA
ncbi:AbrB family transcriptional regulator [Pokkaliibacter sp. CJK22405]|uniref:AbrB family transcriptional regulator n=1 Tax=Pokkaliibacter sp. CJK22405 TaxID=3384615 RepID=UPI003984A877